MFLHSIGNKFCFILTVLALYMVACVFVPSAIENPGPEKLVLLISGGRDARDNHAAFYASLVNVYRMLVTDIGVPAENITVLYYDGAEPDMDELTRSFDAYPQTQRAFRFLLDNSPRVPIDGDTHARTIEKNLRALLAAAPPASQVWVMRVGHGEMDWDYPADAYNSIVYSTMEQLNGESIRHTEFGEWLAEETRAQHIILFLNQCYASEFLELPKTNAKLIVYTATGGDGAPEIGYMDARASPCFTWIDAMDAAFAPLTLTLDAAEKDLNGDGYLSAREFCAYVQTNDRAVGGLFYHHDRPPLTAHPGCAFGSQVNPDELFLVHWNTRD